MLERSLEIREAALGEDHRTVAESLESLATLLRAMGREAEADTYTARARKIRSTLPEVDSYSVVWEEQ